MIGRYRLLLPIGFGGMATVYLARSLDPAAAAPDVALKLVQASAPGFQDLAAHLLREARIVAQIRHPNVVQLIEVGEVAEGIFLAMQYVEGGTLAALSTAAMASGSPLPLSIAGRILCDALSGLHVAHELSDAEGRHLDLVHRDFSPQNILIGVDGAIKLVDFGVARVEHTSNRTRRGLVKGTVSYMSPEQVRGHVIDRRSDVWSAGVVAWEVFAGRRLHPTQDAIATAMSTLTGRIPRLQQARPDVPASVDEVVALALSRDLRRRPQTALELRERLRDALSGQLASDAEVADYARQAFESELLTRRQQVALALAVIDSRPGETTGETKAKPSEPQASSPEPTDFAETAKSAHSGPRLGWGALGLASLLALGVWQLTKWNGLSAPAPSVVVGRSHGERVPPSAHAPRPEPSPLVVPATGEPSVAPPPGSARRVPLSAVRSPARHPQGSPIVSAKPRAPKPPPLADNPYEKSPHATQ